MTPPRPWEWADIDAYSWELATSLKRALLEGMNEGRRDSAETRQAELKAAANKAGNRK